MNSLKEMIDPGNLPRHIAVIMDGNGRWARQRGDERSSGHIAGVESVRRIIEASAEIGLGYLTLYAFSTENWNRPKEEVDMLLHLIVTVIAKETEGLVRNNVRLNVIGDVERLPRESRESLEECLVATAACTGLNLNMCLSYSSRWEITEAARRLASRVAEGSLSPSDIDEKMISDNLTTAGIPDPDLLIRTGGEERISNYLLWQIAYSELYFTDVLWPDFTNEEYADAIIDFQKRERRFGKTSEQVTNTTTTSQI